MNQPRLPFTGRLPSGKAASMRAALEAETAEIARAAAGEPTQLARVLTWFRAQGARGGTQWEALAALSDIPRTSMCARVGTLVELKLLGDGGTLRVSGPYRKPCAVYVATTIERGAAA